MKIESTNVYVGPNMFARFPVIRHVLDLEELEHWPTVRLGQCSSSSRSRTWRMTGKRANMFGPT